MYGIYTRKAERARGMTSVRVGACPWPPINSPPSGCLTYVLYAHDASPSLFAPVCDM